MQNSLRIGMAQMMSASRHDTNISSIKKLSQNAAESNCDLLALPEVSGLMVHSDDQSTTIFPENSDPFIEAACQCAKLNQIWLHIGSTPVRNSNKQFNQSVLIDSSGIIRCRYNKIHLFDYVPFDKEPFRESDRFEHGQQAVAVQTPWGLWGMLICYDLRFPQIFREYAMQGVGLIFVPSAFTVHTGKAHWRALLRARAIENGCWIAASAQVGKHEIGRKTYGHSMIVSPWGRVVIDMGGEGTGFVAQTVNLGAVETARNSISSLQHDREYSMKIENEIQKNNQ